ncbi:MAG: SRPBCC family protein [Rhodospirillales bacterium]|nr:SRPBCC family protein [Rhodospirillales bacterium]
MTDTATLAAYGVVSEPMAVRIERMLPGPIERVWSYLTDSELRGRWLAKGEMDLRVGGRVELIWRNAELTPHNETPPEGHSAEHRMESVITRLDPPRLLAFGWQGGAEVTFELEPVGREVRLVINHRKLPGRDMLRGVSAGWHSHLDVLVAVVNERVPGPFWPAWQRLRDEYDQRLPR